MQTLIASTFGVLVLCLLVIDQVQLERHEVKLDDKFVFGWEVNEENGSIELDGTAETLGYVGIGISPKGKMDRAEMSIGGVDDNDGHTYYGLYVGRHHKVKLDRKRKWKLLEARQNETHTFVKYSRPLASYWLMNTLNLNIPIKDKKTFVIWATGKSDKIKKHHGHGTFKVNLIHPGNDTDLRRSFLDYVDV